MMAILRMLITQRHIFLLGLLVLAFAAVLAGCGKTRIDSSEKPVRYGALSGSAVIRTAKTQLGKKYVYGGHSPQTGFDCSGLIYWSYQQYSVKVPRTTAEQRKAGRAVSMKQMRQGDIVVFRTGRARFHTGMYSGGGKFIHSPSRGKHVREDSLAAQYWKERLVSVRRVF